MFNDTHLPPSEVDGAQAGFADDAPRDGDDPAPRFSRLALCVTAAGALTLGVLGTVAYGVWFNHDQQTYVEAIASARQSLGMPATPDGLPVKQVVSAQAPLPSVFGNPPMTGTAFTGADSSDRNQPDQQGGQLEAGSEQAVWSGQVARAPAATPESATTTATAPAAGLAAPQLATPAASASAAPSLHSGRRATGTSSSSGAQQSASSRNMKDARAGQQERRATSADTRPGGRQNARRQSTLFARMSLFFRRVGYRQHGGANPQQQDIYSHP